MINALSYFVAEAPCDGGGKRGGLQPMLSSFGLRPELPVRIRDKRRRCGDYRARALTDLAATAGPGDPDALAG